MLTQVRLKERLHYETETGKWLWLIRKGKCLPGSAAGSNDLDGYLLIQIDGKLYRANRLAFLYVKGSWPRHKADHIDGDPTNCKWNNLQDITQAHNCLKKRTPVTNKSGYRGVSFHKASGQWKAKFRNDELGIRRTRERRLLPCSPENL